MKTATGKHAVTLPANIETTGKRGLPSLSSFDFLVSGVRASTSILPGIKVVPISLDHRLTDRPQCFTFRENDVR